MHTLKNHRTGSTEVIVSFECSQGGKIYPFSISFNPTPHCQCVLAPVGCFVHRLSVVTIIIMIITRKRTDSELNGLQFWQIWVISPSTPSLSNTTESQLRNALLPRTTDRRRGRSVNSNQSLNPTSQREWWGETETTLADTNGPKRREIDQFKSTVIGKRRITNLNRHEFWATHNSEHTAPTTELLAVALSNFNTL